jgi:uncharacterized membrane protein
VTRPDADPASSAPSSRLRRAVRGTVIGLFTASGALHLLKPSAFDELLPPSMPAPVAVNAAAGVVELLCAYGLIRRRAWARPASVVTLLAVWPSNLQYAVAATADAGVTSPKALVAWARMPLQIPMIWAVLMPVEEPRRDAGFPTHTGSS